MMGSKPAAAGNGQRLIVGGLIAAVLLLTVCDMYWSSEDNSSPLESDGNLAALELGWDEAAVTVSGLANFHSQSQDTPNQSSMFQTVEDLQAAAYDAVDSPVEENEKDRAASPPLPAAWARDAMNSSIQGLTAHSSAKGTHGGAPNRYTSPVTYEVAEQEDRDGEYVAFIGVFSSGAPGGVVRRRACRATWFPSTATGLETFEDDFNVKLRFVVGKTADGKVPHEIVEEEEEHGQLLHLDVIDEYDNRQLKMLRFFKTVPRLFSARYFLKVDDDIYVRPDRVSYAVTQWTAANADYIGCKRQGGAMLKDPAGKFYEPHRHLVHNEKYFLHMAAPAFAVSRYAASLLGNVPEGGLRLWAVGEVSLGSWFLALNVQHWEDTRLCSPNCNQKNVVAHWASPGGGCRGQCSPEEVMQGLHKQACGREPIIPTGKFFLPEGSQSFDSSKEKCHVRGADRLDHRECRKVPAPPPASAKPPPPPPAANSTAKNPSPPAKP